MATPPQFRTFTKEALARTIPGNSGATKIGVTPIDGLVGSPAEIQATLEAINDSTSKQNNTLEDFTNEARNVILQGGGDISWFVVANKFKWNQRFLLMPVSQDVSISRFLTLPMPTAGVTDAAGVERASVDGITLKAWESLWLIHTRGFAPGEGNSWKVLHYLDAALIAAYFDDENAYLIASVSGEAGNSALYIRNGLVVPPGRRVRQGYGAVAPLWGEVDQKPDTFPPATHNHDALYPAGDPSAPTDGYVWTYDTASGGWLPKPLPASSAAVNSVDGRTGAVTLGDLYIPTATPIFSGDLNAISGTGFWRVSRDGVTTNTPPALAGDHPWFYLSQIEHASIWRVQEARDFNDNSVQARELRNGVWGAWAQVPWKADKTKLDGISGAANNIVPIPGGTGNFIAGASVGTGVQKTADLRGYGAIGLDAKGVFAVIFITTETTMSQVYFDSGDVLSDTGSARLISDPSVYSSLIAPLKLGESGTNAGKISFSASRACSGVYAWATGYWR